MKILLTRTITYVGDIEDVQKVLEHSWLREGDIKEYPKVRIAELPRAIEVLEE